MPPFERLPGLHGQAPPGGWEEPPEEWSEEEEPPEEWWDEADGEEEEPHVRITSLDDLAGVLEHPEDHPNRDTVCVVQVPFRDAPLMLERLEEAVKIEDGEGIQFVGNLDRLRQASDFHAGLSRLFGYLGALRTKLHDEGTIDRNLVAAIKDVSPRLAVLCGVQPEILRDSARPLIDGVMEMLQALAIYDAPAATTPKHPSVNVTAVLSQVGDLLKGLDALLLEGAVLQYPEAEEATFLTLHNEGAQEEQKQEHERYVFQIKGWHDLCSILDEPHKYFLQNHFSVTELRFADAPRMFRDLGRAADEKGWWIGNFDRLQQASLLKARFSRIYRSIDYVLMGLKDQEIDWFEFNSIKESTVELRSLCTLQQEDFCDHAMAIISRVESLLDVFPGKPDDLCSMDTDTHISIGRIRIRGSIC